MESGIVLYCLIKFSFNGIESILVIATFRILLPNENPFASSQQMPADSPTQIKTIVVQVCPGLGFIIMVK